MAIAGTQDKIRSTKLSVMSSYPLNKSISRSLFGIQELNKKLNKNTIRWSTMLAEIVTILPYY